jgi:hypothetical protein
MNPPPSVVARGNDLLRPRTEATIRRWQPRRNLAGTRLGFLSVELPSGLVINDAKLMIGPKGKHWIAMPSVQRLAPNGDPLLDANGKPSYSKFVEFRDRATSDRFGDMVLDALRRQHPKAFDGGGVS